MTKPRLACTNALLALSTLIKALQQGWSCWRWGEKGKKTSRKIINLGGRSRRRTRRRLQPEKRRRKNTREENPRNGNDLFVCPAYLPSFPCCFCSPIILSRLEQWSKLMISIRHGIHVQLCMFSVRPWTVQRAVQWLFYMVAQWEAARDQARHNPQGANRMHRSQKMIDLRKQ